jgi:phospholipase C
MTRFRTCLLCVIMLCAGSGGAPTSAAPATSPATKTPIKHFVTLMQSNRTFDNYFGTYPGADGIPPDTCMPVDASGETGGDCVAPFHVPSFEEDLSHTHLTFERQYRSGEMNGFIDAFRQRGELNNLTMGWLNDQDVPFDWNVADEYVLFDRYFSSAAAGSTPNRMFWVSGTAGVTDLDRVGVPESGWGDLPTIFDSLEAQGISWKFYIEKYKPSINYRNRGDGGISAQFAWAPVLSFDRFLDDPELASHIVDLDQYYTDLEQGTLPAVSYIATVGSSEHPPSNPEAGQRLIRKLVTALMQSDAWSSSAFMWAHDDWGGWYDHVPPPQVDRFGYGFRVPALLVSPYAKKAFVDSTVLDHTSVLRFIEDNWGVAPLAERDANANSIDSAFDFTQSPRPAALISLSRTPPAALVIPDRSAIYAVYAAATGFAALVVLVAFLWPERSRNRLRGAGRQALKRGPA